jgi:succinate dehydrogenase / fumarate reductase cytochrome b subunit
MVQAIPITASILMLFVLGHGLGAGLAVLNPAAFERYATALHHAPWLLPLEISLALAALAHLGFSVQRLIANRRARGGVPYSQWRSRRGQPLAGLSGRMAPVSGGLLLLFLVGHLTQLRWHRPGDGLERQALALALASPWALTLYVLAGVALGLHLLHGAESLSRTLGWLDESNAKGLRLASRALAAVVGAGFALLPLALRSAGAVAGAGL